MHARLGAAPVVADFAASVQTLVLGLYIGGSLATGDYRPAVSDIDAVALVERAPSPAVRAALQEIHQGLAHQAECANRLHCVYVPLGHVSDVARRHWTWAFGEFFRRHLSGIARAELLSDPIVMLGPAPATWLTPMSVDELQEAARSELSGYWSRALQKKAIWLEDVYVDIGLTVWARAAATIEDGVLITKSRAIAGMSERGVPLEIVDGITHRRCGTQTAPLSEEQRRHRATYVRTFLKTEIDRLLWLPA